MYSIGHAKDVSSSKMAQKWMRRVVFRPLFNNFISYDKSIFDSKVFVYTIILCLLGNGIKDNYNKLSLVWCQSKDGFVCLLASEFLPCYVKTFSSSFATLWFWLSHFQPAPLIAFRLHQLGLWPWVKTLFDLKFINSFMLYLFIYGIHNLTKTSLKR